MLAMRPTELTRGAIEHEYHERALRGSFMNERKLLDGFSLQQQQSLPGSPQLQRPCYIEGTHHRCREEHAA